MTQERPQEDLKRSATIRSPVIVVAIISAIMVSFIVFSLYNNYRVAIHHAPLGNATMQVKHEATLAHLELEEILSDYPGKDITDVWKHFDKSAWYIQVMLQGGNTGHGVFLLLRNPSRRRDLQRAQAELAELRSIAKQRWAAKNQPDISVPLAQKFDRVFTEFHAQTERLHASLRSAMKKDLNEFFRTKITLIILIIIMSTFLIFTLRRYEKKQRQDFIALQKAEEAQHQSRKLESIGRLAGGVAHDFNNMLGVIIGHADFALKELDTSHPSYADLEEIQKAAHRSAELTRQLLAFARKQTVIPKILDLNHSITGMLKMLEKLIGAHIDFSWKPEDELWPVKIDPSQIVQILANLCVNARTAIDGVGKITIATQNTHLDKSYSIEHPEFLPGDYVVLSVNDTGSGMDKETLKLIFEPFYTTQEVGSGTGLGLATVYGIVKQNQGIITVESTPEQGSTFKVYLPRQKGQIAENHSEVKKDVPRGQGETILLVDDEKPIAKMATKLLEELGYRVLTATSPNEAIKIAEEETSKIALLLTDVVMPKLGGRDLAQELSKTHPHLKKLYMSGYTADIIATHGVLDDETHFIQKPFSRESLAIKVREAIEQE